MNIIFATNKNGKAWSLNVGQYKVFPPLLFLVLCGCGALLFAVQPSSNPQEQMVQAGIADAAHPLLESLSDLEQVRNSVEQHMDALALRLGQMQAQLIRLNALGQRLTEMADLEEGEFSFHEVPARGGPIDASQATFSSAPEFLQDLDKLSMELTDRERQLTVIEALLMNRNVHEQVYPAGRPVLGGWTSSPYGNRRNPFNGRRELHSGVDFAGKRGSPVVVVAAGVVTQSSRSGGFGNLVVIDHGNGYVTRYAHNDRNLVKVGQRVTKGEKIALMGSTGRSTGPHVHFEVLYNGKKVNPTRHIKAGS